MLGVSATHIDWTMVPYVRKSFYKHYKDACKYIEDECDIKETLEFSIEKPEDVSIDDKDVYKWPNRYKYAMDMTIKEVYQAVEGMYHNLNY